MKFFAKFAHSPEPNENLENAQAGETFPLKEMNGIIQQGISDYSTTAGKSKKQIESEMLRKSVIPFNGDEEWIFETSLYDAARHAPIDCYPEKVGIGSSLETAFQQLCKGIDGKPRHAHGLPYVQLAYDMALENNLVLHTRLAEGADPRVNLMRDFDTIRNLLVVSGRDIPSSIETLLSSDSKPLVHPAFAIVLDNWDILQNYQVCYKFLMYLMASTDNWRDTAAQRMRLREACLEVSNCVRADDAVKQGWFVEKRAYEAFE